MLRDYEVELLEKMVQEDQYKNNIPLCTPFIKDFLEDYKKLKERAIPMKVKVERIVFPDTFQEFKRYTSPCCGHFIGDNFIGKLEILNFCPKCGQALDWSNDEK